MARNMQQIQEAHEKGSSNITGHYFGALDNLKADGEMDGAERSRQAWGAYDTARLLLRQAVEQRNQQLEERETSLKKTLFSPSSPMDQEAYQRAVREALGNVFQLGDLLAVARKTGDKNLARAAFSVADETGDELVVSEYLNHNPDARELYEELKAMPDAETRASAVEGVGPALIEPTESMVRPTPEAVERAEAAQQYRPLAG